MERHLIQNARVVSQHQLCREHYRLTLQVPQLPPTQPGQFVHLSPLTKPSPSYNVIERNSRKALTTWRTTINLPVLRRAFSIAELTENQEGYHIDVIYRVVGAATRWMKSLADGDSVSVLGPLGNSFPIRTDKPIAWCVSGGVGLPPMLWLSRALRQADRQAVAFCGAQTADLLALNIHQNDPPSKDASTATPSCEQFNRNNVPVVISTDDGTLGYHGHIGAALTAYYEANPIPAYDIVVYTCGPERMMEFVANFCKKHSIECHVCMERGMACGTGMCQSCVLPVHDENGEKGWRYSLCCTEGPIYDARRIIWGPVSVS